MPNIQMDSARKEINLWYLGRTSTKFETGGRGVTAINPGGGDHGGASYGAYQLSKNAGTLDAYLKQSAYGSHFNGLEVGTPVFDEKWCEIALSDPGFGKEQHDFIALTHYGVELKRLQEVGIDLSDRGRAIQDALWSTSVQFGPGTRRIFYNGLQEKFGKDYNLSSLSDSDIVDAIQDYKIAHNKGLFKNSSKNWPGLLNRAAEEKDDLLRLDKHEKVLAQHNELPDWRLSNHLPDFRFPNGNATVGQIQLNLNQLGLAEIYGPLVADGKAGGPNSRTSVAIAAFKQQHGLTEPISNTELLMATQIALNVKQSLDFDRPILDGLPGPARTPQIVNGLPDYMVSGPNALSQKPSTAQTPQAPLQVAPSHMAQHIAIPPPDTQRDQAPGSFAPSAHTAAFEPDPVAARLAELQREMDALRRQMQYDSPSPHNGPAPYHEADLRADARSAAMGAPGRSNPERESEPEPALAQPLPQRDAQVIPAGHRDYALFEAIRRQLPNEYSDDMAAHVMLQAKQGSITRPDQIGGMGVENGRMVVMGKSGADWAIVELDARVPAMQETLSQSQTFDQQQVQQHEQWLAQEAQLSQGRGMSRSL